MRRSWSLTVAVAVAFLASLAEARTIEGKEFPEEVNVAGHLLKLVGVGLRDKWGIINIYVMGVYMVNPKKSARHIIHADEPKLLWIKMLRNMSGETMANALQEGLEKNCTEEEYAQVKDRVAQLKAKFPEKIPKGADVGFTYLPGKGMLLRYGTEDKGAIPGKDFMVAMFKIWFGKKPADKDLKKAILKAD
jgi:hypothetical protein